MRLRPGRARAAQPSRDDVAGRSDDDPCRRRGGSATARVARDRFRSRRGGCGTRLSAVCRNASVRPAPAVAARGCRPYASDHAVHALRGRDAAGHHRQDGAEQSAGRDRHGSHGRAAPSIRRPWCASAATPATAGMEPAEGPDGTKTAATRAPHGWSPGSDGLKVRGPPARNDLGTAVGRGCERRAGRWPSAHRHRPRGHARAPERFGDRPVPATRQRRSPTALGLPTKSASRPSPVPASRRLTASADDSPTTNGGAGSSSTVCRSAVSKTATARPVGSNFRAKAANGWPGRRRPRTNSAPRRADFLHTRPVALSIVVFFNRRSRRCGPR